MRPTFIHHARRRAAASAAVAGALLLATAGVAGAAERPSGAATPVPKAALDVTAPSSKKVSRPRTGHAKLDRRSAVRTTFDHTEHRNRTGGYELARTYADQAISTSSNCAAYAGIGRTTDYLSRVGARRPSAATPVLRALSPIYKFADWLVGKFFTTPCDLAKQLTKTAATVTAVAYWEGEVYHRVRIQKEVRDWGRIDLCRFAAFTYFRSRGQWYVIQTMDAHLPARGDWGNCRP